MQNYHDFLSSKRTPIEDAGFAVGDEDLHPQLFDFQKQIVLWALRRGRAAVFSDCGTGKSPMQLEWARHITAATGRPVLILAPLAVAQQTVREGQKFGIPVTICRSQADVQPGVNITNYEMLAHFQADAFAGLVLDESSILKSYSGVLRKAITDFGAQIAYRLACTATPAPNDLIEIINHAEFLGIMAGKEIIALYFTQDGNTTHAWRLKGHARADFWRWLAGWAVALRKPSDLGYPDVGFVLPPLELHQVTVPGAAPEGMLFAVDAQSLDEQRRAKRATLGPRVQACADLVNGTHAPWLVWCELNTESEALRKAIPGAVEVRGSDTPEQKEAAMLGFVQGTIRVVISKPSIMGFGMNFQHCRHMAFVGLSNSFEQQYQAIRRCWRFGQTQPVECYQIVSENEGAVVANLQRKEAQAAEMMQELVANMAGLSLDRAGRDEMTYATDVAHGVDWTAYLGDSIEESARIADESVDFTIFSPPFPGMYAYTNSTNDVGNTESIDQMIAHFRYLIPQLYRVTKPGRLCAIHLMQLTAMKSRDGYIGIKDYRGRTIAAMEEGGWIYAGEVTIDKNPQVQATRNKERGLLFKTLATDSSLMRMALADYLIYFRKPGANPRPIHAGMSGKYNPGAGWITEEEWIEWASPVWYRHMDPHGKTAQFIPDYPGLHQCTCGISETDVLNVVQARETDDERHLCPLQLGVIERAVKLWSAPGELVFSPFMGIGSEGYQALQLGRRFVGIELKRSYWASACRNLARAVAERDQPTLFDLLPAEAQSA